MKKKKKKTFQNTLLDSLDLWPLDLDLVLYREHISVDQI